MRGIFNIRLVALAAALCALAIVAAGCGSDDGGDSTDGGGNPTAEVKAVVVESFAFEDPETVCEENLTEAALEDGYEGEDHEARLEACKEDEPADVGEITFRGVEVKGDTATADVTATRPNGRQSKFTVRLLDEDGWRIDGTE